MQRSLTVAVSGLNLRPMVQQERHKRGSAKASRFMEGTITSPVRGIHVCPKL